MWRAVASRLLLHRRPSPASATATCTQRNLRLFSGLTPQPRPAEAEFSPAEARRVVRLVGVEVLKRRLRNRGEEVVSYGEFLDACVEAGAARTHAQAQVLARAMDQSGVVLLVRGNVYLHPEKVVNLVRSALPPVLEVEADNDVRTKEFELLKKKKEDIDTTAHEQVRKILWCGFGLWITQVGLCFRLTYWEFSWKLTAPIAFFAVGSFVLASYAYFLVTLSDLSCLSFVERLFSTRRAKLCRKHSFDMEKYMEMEKHIRCPLGGDYSQAATKVIFEKITGRLQDWQDKVVGHDDVLDALLERGLERTEAMDLARKMDENSLVLFVSGKAYLNNKVVDLVRRAVPFALAPNKDARKEELKQLQEKMQEIDRLAHRHARRIICCGLAYFISQFVLFFHLTCEFSWGSLEPIAFFTAAFELLVCYGYFLCTSCNPTLQDFMERLITSKRRKLCAKRNFDMDRYLELQKHSRCPPKGDY